MKVLKFVGLFLLLFSFKTQAQNSDRQERINNYIKKYKNVAMREQKRVGIPAAITLAQGIHETNAGASELAVNANNHFGIKCKKEWTGETYTYTDDRPDECFRKYGNDLESYKDHSDYLSGSSRYASLFKLSMTDYAGWAYGLKKCGYATNPKYAQMLINIVESNHLQEFTYAALSKDFDPIKEAEQPVVMASSNTPTVGEVVPDNDTPQSVANKNIAPTSRMIVNDGTRRFTVIKNHEKPEYGQNIIVNGLKAFYAKQGTSLLDEAINYGIRYSKLLEINDLPDAPLESDMFIYLEKKNPKGSSVYHVVKPGETMLQIAQIEGIQLKNLRQLNKIKENEEPVGGSLLQLQETISEKPDVIVKETKLGDVKFAGSDSRVIPQGATRTSSGYITKKEIEQTEDIQKPIEKEITKSTNEEDNVIHRVNKAAEVVVDESTVKTTNENIAKTEEKTTTLEPDKTVVVETNTVIQPLTEPDTTPVIEKETTVATPEEKDIIVQEKATVGITKIEDPEATKEVINIADTKAVEEEKPVEVKKEEEPKDEFARLKARLDKAVYASDNVSEEEAKDAKPEVKPIAQEKKESSKTNTANPVYYTVKKGDNAFAIAKKYNITMAQLKEWNKLDFSEIKAGQKLRVK